MSRTLGIPISDEALNKLLTDARKELPVDLIFTGCKWDPERRVFCFFAHTESGMATAEGGSSCLADTIYRDEVDPRPGRRLHLAVDIVDDLNPVIAHQMVRDTLLNLKGVAGLIFR